MLDGYRERLPLLPGAREAVERIGARYPLGLASSSNRPVIDLVLERMGVADRFRATVSSEEVARGKPAPDVYQEVVRRLGVADAAAIEDSEAGIRSAHAAGLRVIAIPNPHFPPARRGARARRRGPSRPRRAEALSRGERVVARRVQREPRRGAGDLEQPPDRPFGRDDVQALA